MFHVLVLVVVPLPKCIGFLVLVLVTGVGYWNGVRALGQITREFAKKSQAIMLACNHQRIVDFENKGNKNGGLICVVCWETPSVT